MKKLYEAKDLPEAHILRGLLETAGIDAIVRGQSLDPLRGAIPLTEQPSVWIMDDADEERAVPILEEYLERVEDPREHSPWTCSSCGEEIAPQFTECWSCGTSRSGPYR